MEPTLHGVHLKMWRAYEHYRTLRDESPSIVSGNRIIHTTVPQAHPDGRGYNFDLPAIQRLDADLWAVVLGDFLFNLRSALDQLVYQLHVIRYSGEVPETVERASAFPIKVKRPTQRKGGGFLPTSRWSQIGTLGAEPRAMIERFQPYNTRNDALTARRGALLMLDTLNNIDKHRRLHVVRHVVSRSTAPVFPARYGFVASPKINAAVGEPGAKVDQWRFKFIDAGLRPELARQVQMHGVVLEEVLDEPTVKMTVYELTRNLHNAVLGVVGAFRPFFRAAGARGDDVKLPKPIPKEYGPIPWDEWSKLLDERFGL